MQQAYSCSLGERVKVSIRRLLVTITVPIGPPSVGSRHAFRGPLALRPSGPQNGRGPMPNGMEGTYSVRLCVEGYPQLSFLLSPLNIFEPTFGLILFAETGTSVTSITSNHSRNGPILWVHFNVLVFITATTSQSLKIETSVMCIQVLFTTL